MHRPSRRALAIGATVVLGAVATQIVVAATAEAHTPSASITCTTWSIGAVSYDAAENNTYSYSIDGASSVTGTFPSSFGPFSGTFPAGSGNHTLTGYVYENNDPTAQYSQTYDLATTDCASSNIPIPAAPSPTPPTCSAPGVATIPADTSTVHWTLVGNVATATAQGGDEFTDGTTTISFTETPLPQLDAGSNACTTPVTAVAPVFTNGDCATAPTLTGAVDGTGYTVAIVGTPAFGATVTVTFTATTGYRLSGQSTYSFTYAAAPDCRTVVDEVNPTVVQATCDHSTGVSSGFLITPAVTANVTYTVNGLVVTATAASGFKLGTPAGWTAISDTVATFTAVQDTSVCLADINPAAPAVSQAACLSGTAPATLPTLTFATTPNVVYSANPGPYAAGTTVTVTATAANGYEFTSASLPVGWSLVGGGATAGSASYSVAFTAALNCGQATAPVFRDDTCAATPGTTGSSYTIAATVGIDYYVGAVKQSAGVHSATDGSTVTVTAVPQSGYDLVGSATWTHHFTATPLCTGAEAASGTTPLASTPLASTPLASTGFPIGWALGIGLLLAMVGSALTLSGTRTRWARR